MLSRLIDSTTTNQFFILARHKETSQGKSALAKALANHQKREGHSRDMCGTIVSVDISFQARCYCTSQGSQLVKTDDCFSPLIASIAP